MRCSAATGPPAPRFRTAEPGPAPPRTACGMYNVGMNPTSSPTTDETSLKVSLLQTDPRPGDVAGNLTRGFALIEDAAAVGSDLVILPEMWPRSFVDAVADPGTGADWDAELRRWQKLHARLGIAGLGGWPMPGPDGRWRNSLLAIGPDGRIEARYDKMHLFNPMAEGERYGAGEQPVVWTHRGMRFGLTVCYDLRFPELFRALRSAGAEVLVVVAQWPLARIGHWDVLLRARAIENQCYVVGVNRSGAVPHNNDELAFGGGSAVIDPWGEAHWVAGDRPMVGHAVLHRSNILERRRRFPVWDDRHPGLAGI